MDLILGGKTTIFTGGRVSFGKAIGRDLVHELVDVITSACWADLLEDSVRGLYEQTGRRHPSHLLPDGGHSAPRSAIIEPIL